MQGDPVGAVVFGLWALLWGSVAGLVYRDAAEDGRVRAAAWALVVLVFGIFGVVAYKAGDWISFGRPA